MEEQINFSLDADKAQKLHLIFKSAGLTPEQAFTLFADKTIATGKLPFDAEKPNNRLQKALTSKDYIAFTDPQAGLRWLNE